MEIELIKDPFEQKHIDTLLVNPKHKPSKLYKQIKDFFKRNNIDITRPRNILIYIPELSFLGMKPINTLVFMIKKRWLDGKSMEKSKEIS